MGPNLLGNSAGVFTKITDDLLERRATIQLTFNVKSVGSGKMLMVTWDIFIHDVSFHRCQKQSRHSIYAGLNATCAQVTSTEETKGGIYFCNLGKFFRDMI